MSPEQTPDPQSRPPEESEEDSDNESDSDDEPSAYRPVRVIKIKRTSGWREKFPFSKNHHPSSSSSSELSSVGKGVETSPPIGLGFEERSTTTSMSLEDQSKEILSSNIWGNHLSLELEGGSLVSTSTSTTSGSNSDSMSKEREREMRKRRKWELKEVRKWRRRQWDVVPVTIRPEPVSREGGSLRVTHELEEGMYAFRGQVQEGDEEELGSQEEEEEEEEEGWELDHGEPGEQTRRSSSLAAATEEEPIKMSEEKRGSVVSTTARSMYSGVGTFFSNALLWSTSAQSPNPQDQEDELPPLPFEDDAEEEEVLDERDAEEVGMEEVLRRFGEDEEKRRKESFQSAVVLVPTSRQKEMETKKEEIGSPPLPELPQVPKENGYLKPLPQEVPLPPSIVNTPRIGEAEGKVEERERVLA